MVLQPPRRQLAETTRIAANTTHPTTAAMRGVASKLASVDVDDDMFYGLFVSRIADRQ
jgi:hypothetical protein